MLPSQNKQFSGCCFAQDQIGIEYYKTFGEQAFCGYYWKNTLKIDKVNNRSRYDDQYLAVYG
jgi:hypothetical protein